LKEILSKQSTQKSTAEEAAFSKKSPYGKGKFFQKPLQKEDFVIQYTRQTKTNKFIRFTVCAFLFLIKMQTLYFCTHECG